MAAHQDGGSTDNRPVSPGWLVRSGMASWSFIGVVLVITIIVAALGAIAEVAIPVMLACLLAVLFKPAADSLVRRGLKPSLAAGLVILVLAAVLVG